MKNSTSLKINVFKYVLCLSLFFGANLLNAQDAKEVIALSPSIKFENTVHDFGTIKEADGKVSATFTFTNTGDKPLVVNNVSASCGCTVSKWTKEPVQPGETGVVEATYNTAGRVHPFDKTLTVSSNGEPKSIVLHIKGTVEK